MRSAIFEISILLGAVILGWQKTGLNFLFYIALALIVFYVIVMVIYIITKGSAMSWLDRLLGVIAIFAWLAIAWLLTQEKGLHLWGL